MTCGSKRDHIQVFPSSNSSATWCIMANASMVQGYLLMSIKSDVLDITIGIIKKVLHFNGEKPLFYNI